jgi:coenzyme F420-reducing hydrogenase delta subunit
MTRDAFEPKIAAFCCNWCSYAGADLAGTGRLKYPENIRIIRVPCSSRVDPSLVLRAFQNGADGVMIAGCHPGDCHYDTGNYHARKRMMLLKSLLEFIGLSPARLVVKWISGNEAERFQASVESFTRELKRMGACEKARDLRCAK